MEAACVSTSAVRPCVYVGYIQRKNKTKKVQKRKPKWCVAEDPSGDKLVLGRGAALGGRVCVRLVADDHFWRDAQPLFDNTATKNKDKEK